MLSKAQQIGGLIIWLLISFTVAATGAMASIQAAQFYANMLQPAWAPPAWLFGPVWSALYLMMAVAAWLVWRKGGFSAARVALSLFLLQLVLNALWSWLFFAWHLGALAFIDILIMWVFIVLTIITFKTHNKIAAWLLVPYLAWVSFAAVLNFSVWQLNPAILG
jgi:benzodiazapine receptor